MRKVLKISVFIIYLFSALLIVPEVFLRALGFHGESDKETFLHYDKDLGWFFIPNTVGYDSELEWDVKYYINEDGFREKSNIGKKEKGAYRILILGDSFTEGYGIRQDKRFSCLTEDLLRKRGRKVEVINAGVRGYDMAQYYLVFQRIYGKYDPDLVIIAIVSGDLEAMADKLPLHGAEVYYKPYYALENGVLALKGVPVPKPDRHIFKNDRFDALKKYLRHSAFYTFLRVGFDKVDILKKASIRLRLKKDISQLPGYTELISKTQTIFDPMRYNKEENEKVCSAIIKSISDLLRRDDNNLLIFLLFDDELRTNEAYFRDMSARLGFSYASFPQLCDEYRKNKKKYHFIFDNHFNEKADALVAGVLSDFLSSSILDKR